MGDQHLAVATLSPGNSVGTHYRGGWLDPRASMDSCAEEEASCCDWSANPTLSSP